METLKNLIIVASYCVVSLAVALLLPLFAGLSSLASGVVGFMIFVVSAQLHSVYNRRLEHADLANELFELHQDQEAALREIESLRRDLEEVRGQVAEGESRQSGKILAEMKVLQSLLARFAEKAGIEQQEVGVHRQAKVGRSATAGDINEIVRNALEENRLDVHLQPIVSLPQRKMRHYEVFSRVRDETGRLIYPPDFLPVAEESGLIGTLDSLLLFRCVQVIRQLRDRRPDVRFFCNISASSIRDEDFFKNFVDFLRDNQSLADRLVFEFPQADVGVRDETIERNLQALASIRFQFSMDRVSDLEFDPARLSGANFKFVKLPVNLLVNDHGDIASADLKEAFARHNIDLIAERIEDERMLVDVLDYNVDFGQGFLFGEPRPARALDEVGAA